jgi:hypothetical protein
LDQLGLALARAKPLDDGKAYRKASPLDHPHQVGMHPGQALMVADAEGRAHA